MHRCPSSAAHVALAFALVVVGASLASRPAMACSYLQEETRFFLAEAPVGGVWWLHGHYFDEEQRPLTRIPLERDEGSPMFADVVSRGPGGSIALQVPPAAQVGDRFLLPDFTDNPWDGAAFEELVVIEGEAPLAPGSVPPPDFTVEVRETRVGYVGVMTVPTGDMCSHEPGLWEMHYGDGAFAVLDVPDGFVLDLTVRPEGEGAFDDVTSANQIVLEATPPGEREARLAPPPDTRVEEQSGDADFVAHARLRRIADGAVGPVESVPVHVRGGAEKRLEWVGCSAASSAPWSLAWLGLLLLGVRRRRP